MGSTAASKAAGNKQDRAGRAPAWTPPRQPVGCTQSWAHMPPEEGRRPCSPAQKAAKLALLGREDDIRGAGDQAANGSSHADVRTSQAGGQEEQVERSLLTTFGQM